MGKFVLKPEHLVKLQSLIERNLDGFSRGEFEKEEVRKTVEKLLAEERLRCQVVDHARAWQIRRVGDVGDQHLATLE